jgi:L-galactonate dehydratase
MVKITGFTTRDVRFPVRHCSTYKPRISNNPQTSLDKTGSDAMNAAGDYSSAYCIIYTDSDHTGHGMVRSAQLLDTSES